MIACDFDPADVYHSKKVRAAKPHKCCECLGEIRKGEEYEQVSILFDHEWSTFKTCPDCLHLRCEITRAYSDDCGWLHGGMQEQLDVMRGWALYDDKARRLLAMYKTYAPLRAANLKEQPCCENTPISPNV